MQKKSKLGLFLGRFQPLHFGHLSAINQGLEYCDQIILMIGSANRNFDLKNPLTIEERMQLINTMIKQEKLEKRIHTLTTINDNPNNLEWVDTMIKSVSQFDIVIGNNNLVSVLTQYRGFAQYKPILTKRQKHQGTIIRHAIMEYRTWKDLVPNYTHDLLESFNFEQRLRDLSIKGD